jgi:hypothetical protein
MASNYHMTVNSELDRILRKLFWPKIKRYTDICTEALSKTMKTSVRIANVQAEIRTQRLPNTSLKHCHSRLLARMGLGCITLCYSGRLTCARSVCNYEPWNWMQSFFNFRMPQKLQLLSVCYHRYACSTSHDHWDAGSRFTCRFSPLYRTGFSTLFTNVGIFQRAVLSCSVCACAGTWDCSFQ